MNPNCALIWFCSLAGSTEVVILCVALFFQRNVLILQIFQWTCERKGSALCMLICFGHQCTMRHYAHSKGCFVAVTSGVKSTKVENEVRGGVFLVMINEKALPWLGELGHVWKKVIF